MVKYGKVSDREVQLCFHARIITIITVKVEFSRVLAFMMFWNDFFNFCKYDRFLVLLLHDLYFVVYFVWSLIRKKWETRSDANFSPFTVYDGQWKLVSKYSFEWNIQVSASNHDSSNWQEITRTCLFISSLVAYLYF